MCSTLRRAIYANIVRVINLHTMRGNDGRNMNHGTVLVVARPSPCPTTEGFCNTVLASTWPESSDSLNLNFLEHLYEMSLASLGRKQSTNLTAKANIFLPHCDNRVPCRRVNTKECAAHSNRSSGYFQHLPCIIEVDVMLLWEILLQISGYLNSCPLVLKHDECVAHC